MKYLTILSFGLLLGFASCQGNNTKQSHNTDSTTTKDINPGDTITNPEPDSTLIVRENFNRINAIKDWDKIDSAEIHESTEGGIAKYYTKNNVLELIKVRNYGEGGYTFQDFYLKNGKLSFVFEELYNYNTHIIDPKFDIGKTKKVGEVRYYYFEDKLFNIIATDKENEKYLKDDKDTDKYIKDMFDVLIKIKDNNFNPKGISE